MSEQLKFGFVLEYVTDVEAATRFYVEVLGLEVRRRHPTFVQFDDFAIASDESLSGTRQPELYWVVEDAQAAFDELSRRAEVVMPLRDLPFGKVFAVRSPSGQPLFLLQWSQNRPSQAVGV